MNKYFSRVLKIFVFIFFVIVFDQIIGLILSKYYFTQISGWDCDLTYTLRDCKEEVLIIGNSRAKRHYDTRIISDSLKMSCYDAGIDGGVSLIMSYAIIKVITKRYSPKIIFLEYNADHTLGPGFYDKLSILLPYYDEYPEIRPIVLLRGPYERIKLMSAIYPFNSNILSIIRFNSNTLAAKKQGFNGFVPCKNDPPDIEFLKKEIKMEKEEINNSKADTNVLIALKNIIQICQEKNILLFIVNSPFFHLADEEQIPPSESTKLSFDIMNQNKVNYLDFSYDTTYKNHLEWFNDRIHLSEDGAKVFSNRLMHIVKNNYIYPVLNNKSN
jgi:hypothetical protein